MVTNKKNYLNKNEERVKNYLKTGLYLTDNEIKKKREDKQRKGLSLTLYHFTDKKNLPSIRKHGLYGWKTLEEKLKLERWTDYVPSTDKNGVSQRLDSRYRKDIKGNLTNFIRLTTHKKHWMAENAKQRELDLTFLVIDSKILFDLDCLFSNMNPQKTGSKVNSDINTYVNSDDPHSEIMVHKHIPLRNILRKEN